MTKTPETFRWVGFHVLWDIDIYIGSVGMLMVSGRLELLDVPKYGVQARLLYTYIGLSESEFLFVFRPLRFYYQPSLAYQYFII